MNLLLLFQLLLLLLLLYLLLPEATEELVGVGHELGDEVVLVVVLQVVDLLVHLVVGVGGLLDVLDEGLVLEVVPPVLFEVVHFIALVEGFLLESQGSGDFNWRLGVALGTIG